MLRHNLQSKTCVHPHIVSLSDDGEYGVVSHLFFSSSIFPVLLFFIILIHTHFDQSGLNMTNDETAV